MEFSDYIVRQTESGFAYHLPVTGSCFFSDTLFDNSPISLEKEELEELYRFGWENGISPLWDDHVLLFRIALLVLKRELSCLIVVQNSHSEIRWFLPEVDIFPVSWWYGIRYMEGDALCVESGMCASDQNGELQQNESVLVGMFADEKLLGKYTRLFHSDVTNWFFVFMPKEKEVAIKRMLSDSERCPELSELLTQGTYTANVQIGSDEGFLNYMLLQSKDPMDHLIAEIVEKQHRFIRDYTWLLGECKPFDAAWKVDFFKEQFTGMLPDL